MILPIKRSWHIKERENSIHGPQKIDMTLKLGTIDNDIIL